MCGAYDGPALPDVVAACKLPDGTYWAAQQWAQPLPDLGFAPWIATQRAKWLEISHWQGPIPTLTAYTDWVWSGRFQEVFGVYTYAGQPVHGFGTSRYGVPSDGYGRLIFLDTLNSDVRERLAARELVRVAQPDRRLLLRLLQVRPDEGRLPPSRRRDRAARSGRRREVPAHRARPGRRAERRDRRRRPPSVRPEQRRQTSRTSSSRSRSSSRSATRAACPATRPRGRRRRARRRAAPRPRRA